MLDPHQLIQVCVLLPTVSLLVCKCSSWFLLMIVHYLAIADPVLLLTMLLSTRPLLCLILKHYFPLESFHWYPYVWRCIPSYVTALLLCTGMRHRDCSSFFVVIQVKVISESYFPGAQMKPIIQEDFSECIPVIKHHKTFPPAPVSSVDFFKVFIPLPLFIGRFC